MPWLFRGCVERVYKLAIIVIIISYETECVSLGDNLIIIIIIIIIIIEDLYGACSWLKELYNKKQVLAVVYDTLFK